MPPATSSFSGTKTKRPRMLAQPPPRLNAVDVRRPRQLRAVVDVDVGSRDRGDERQNVFALGARS